MDLSKIKKYLILTSISEPTIATIKYAEIADKNGVRILWSSEPEDNQKFQVNKLKLISGGDKIQVRKLYCNPFEYRPQFSVFIQANDLPELFFDGTDLILSS